jgi:hypothetical protein
MSTISNKTNPLDAAMHAIRGGKFRIRLDDPDAPLGSRWGKVLDDDGNIIGEAHDLPYAGRGFTIRTEPYAGFADLDQIEFVPAP